VENIPESEMMIKNYKTIIFILILIIAFFLRFYKLSVNPPSLTWDEAAWGYNAYALGIDGRDEFGKFLPLAYIESFGDFKPPVYAYLDIMPVKIFGLNEFSTRFPSAFLGSLTVLVTYFLVKRIFYGSKNTDLYALTSVGLLAISPWHINLSRAAFEANVATFFIVTGVWLFLVAVQKNMWYLILSSLSFILSAYTFNTARIVSPLLVVILSISSYKQLLRNKKQVIVGIFFGLLLLLPLIPFLLSPQAKLRFQEVNIFSDIKVIERTNQQIAQDKNVWWSKVIHNRRLAYGVEFMSHFIDNLSPNFLFIKGDGNPKFSTQDVGQIYLWEMPFFIAGLLLLFYRREGAWWIIPCWLLLGLVPAATARETPHALRIETTLPTFQIFTAYGLVAIITIVSSIKYQVLSIKLHKFLIGFIALLVVFSFIYYLNGYYNYYPREFSQEWQYGYKEAVNFVNENYSQYDHVYVTEELGRPYIYVLFYAHYVPEMFRSEAVVAREALGFVHVAKFGKYVFANDLSQLPKFENTKTLYINVSGKVPTNANIIQTFKLLNNDPSLVAYTL
jgi:4-amino-4-deoxy-L-arabinose transferase-like glycosyltransferase